MPTHQQLDMVSHTLNNWPSPRYIYEGLVAFCTAGMLFKCIDVTNNTIVTLKVIYPVQGEESVLSTTLKDISISKELDHPNILKYLGERSEGWRISAALNYTDSDLRKYIQACPTGMNEPLMKSFLYQILQGLSYCHTHNVVHRALKPENILLDSERNTIKLSDFGYSKRVELHANQIPMQLTTVCYHAPELLLRASPTTSAVDIWSVGCIFAEMAKGSALFFGDFDFSVLDKIIKTLGMPNEHNWEGVTDACVELLAGAEWQLPGHIWVLKDLLPPLELNALELMERMLRFLPSERISAAEALQHQYFQGL